jgi:uncharacterized membrane protein YfcA
VSPLDALLLLSAAIGAGIMNAVVGAGTLITFPTLLFLGYPPVVANVSNTVGLVPGSIAGAYGYRATLVGRWGLVRRLAMATATGGLIGGLLLILLPGRAFEVVVPVLLIASAVLAAVQPRVAAAVALRRAARGADRAEPGSEAVGPMLLLGILLAGIYGGYFGAAQGVILLVLLGLALGGPVNGLNGVKNVLAGTANLVSAVLFIVIADVDWQAAAIVAVGATIGGGLGGRYGRRLPSSALRVILVAVALIAALSRLIG